MTRPVTPHERLRADHAAVADMLRRDRQRAWDDDVQPGAGLGLALAASVVGFVLAGMFWLAVRPDARAALAMMMEVK